jgi:hypothetical protein
VEAAEEGCGAGPIEALVVIENSNFQCWQLL